jgi:serine/threonine protein kinase
LGDLSVTANTSEVGTALYASPEQAGLSDFDISDKTDMFSIGMLCHMPALCCGWLQWAQGSALSSARPLRGGDGGAGVILVELFVPFATHMQRRSELTHARHQRWAEIDGGQLE